MGGLAALARLGSGTGKLLGGGTTSIIVFIGPGQDHSRDAMAMMAECERKFAGKPIHWAAVMSDSADSATASSEVKASGTAMPVLIDKGDQQYATLHVILHPVVIITDQQNRLAAYVPSQRIDYCLVVEAQLAHVLLGQALAAQGDCKGARAAFEHALELDKSNTAAQDGLKACPSFSVARLRCDAVRAVRMRARKRLGQGGFTFVAILLALLIAAALYFGYFRMQGAMQGRSSGVAAIDASKAVACRSNRQTIEQTITYWAVEHPDDTPSLATLEHDGLRVPSCPEGGQYTLAGRRVECSFHH